MWVEVDNDEVDVALLKVHDDLFRLVSHGNQPLIAEYLSADKTTGIQREMLSKKRHILGQIWLSKFKGWR